MIQVVLALTSLIAGVRHMLQNLHYDNQHVHPGLRGRSFPISVCLT